MKLANPHHGGLSLSQTTVLLATFAGDEARSTVHEWVHTADVEAGDGRALEKGPLDVAVMNIDDARYNIYAAVVPETSGRMHPDRWRSRRCFPGS